MNVGDLVTLSAVGKDTKHIIDTHKRFFRGPGSTYYGLCADDLDRFLDYWQNDNVIGLVTAASERDGRAQWDYELKAWVSAKKMAYSIAWQANPKGMTSTLCSRNHLKFVKKQKKK
tara:strand:+ start:1601 stop:1948 length:348 start_codon:yes stop_codon:yes gene_type:complete